ncbi:MAG: hypothetical protein N3A71_01115 [Candidatus Dojkabacteria bacterium]|nr:hypothetical protein [Candidatus Dojkabacteria bacterium]
MTKEMPNATQRKLSIEFIDILFYVSSLIISIGTLVFINQSLNFILKSIIVTFLAVLPVLLVLFVKFRNIQMFEKLENPLLLLHVLVSTSAFYAWYEPIADLFLMLFEYKLLHVYYILLVSLVLVVWFWFLSRVLNGNQLLMYFTIITLPVSYISLIQSYLELFQDLFNIKYPFADWSSYYHFYQFIVMTVGLSLFSISNYLYNLGSNHRILMYFVRISALIAIYFSLVAFTSYFAYNDVIHTFLLFFNYVIVLFFFYYFNKIRAVDGYILTSIFLVSLINYSIFYLLNKFDFLVGREYIGTLIFITSGISLLIISVIGYYFLNKKKLVSGTIDNLHKEENAQS